MLRYVNCSWFNFYNFLLNMGIKFHAHCIFYFAHFQKSCMKNGSYLIEIGSESENKWVVDFFVRSKLPGEIQCLVYTGSFLFPFVQRSVLWANFNLRARHFRKFRESLVVQNFFTANQPSSQVWVYFFSGNLHLDREYCSPQTNLFSVYREIRSSQIKVGFHYIEVLTKYIFCKMLH